MAGHIAVSPTTSASPALKRATAPPMSLANPVSSSGGDDDMEAEEARVMEALLSQRGRTSLDLF
eukprot:SAG31_NODE_4334_length_3344_cov_4.039753_2_plen_64_part_00